VQQQQQHGDYSDSGTRATSKVIAARFKGVLQKGTSAAQGATYTSLGVRRVTPFKSRMTRLLHNARNRPQREAIGNRPQREAIGNRPWVVANLSTTGGDCWALPPSKTPTKQRTLLLLLLKKSPPAAPALHAE
jgi:hypothetical protein